MAMKQNFKQEIEATLMEEQQILEDEQFGGIHDEDRANYLDYLCKTEREKYEVERAEAEADHFFDFLDFDYPYDDDEDDYEDEDEDGGYLYGIL